MASMDPVAQAQSAGSLNDTILFVLVTSEGGGRGDPAGGAVPNMGDILIEAIRTGSTGKALELLGKGASPDSVYKSGGSAIRWAAYYGRPEIVKALLDRGASVKMVTGGDVEQQLIRNAILGNVDVIKGLIQKGANIKAQASAGETALHWASLMGNDGVAKKLLASGADVNAVNKAGCTALALASLNGHAQVVRTLLSHGANPDIRSLMGSPEALANLGGHKEVIKILKDSGKSGPRSESGTEPRPGETAATPKSEGTAPSQGVKWSFQVDDPFSWGLEISDGVACFITAADKDHESGSYIYGLDVSSGTQLWKIRVDFQASGMPKLSNGVVYFGSLEGSDHLKYIVCAVDTSSGKLLWKHPTSGQVAWISEVRNGVVYFSNFAAEITALDAKRGKIVWNHRVDGLGPRADGNCIVSYMTLSEKLAFVGLRSNLQGGAGMLLALDIATGKQLWKKDLWSNPSIPISQDGVVYVGTDDGSVFSFDAITGKERLLFSAQKSGIPLGSPLINEVSDGVIYVSIKEKKEGAVPDTGTLVALDAHSGSLKWKFYGPFGYTTSLSSHDNRFYVSGAQGAIFEIDKHSGKLLRGLKCDSKQVEIEKGLALCTTAAGVLYAMDIGKASWFSVTADDLKKSAQVTTLSVPAPDTSPAAPSVPESQMSEAGKPEVYSASRDADSSREVSAVKTGVPEGLKWKAPGNKVWSEMALQDGMLFYFPKNDLLTAVDVTNGREKLRVPNSWQEELAVSDGLVYFRHGQPLYCFDIKAGKLKWEQDKWTNREIVVSDGILVTRTANDDLCAFDAKSGRELWDFVVGDRLFNPTVYKGRVYSNCQNRTIYGIDLKTGKEKFRLKLEKPEYLTGHFVIYKGLLICKVYLEDPSKGGAQDGTDGKYFIMAVDVETRKIKWKTQCQNFLFKPAASEGIVILEFEESISAFDATNGQQIWQKPMPGVNNQPLIIEGTVYVGCDDEFLYALDLKNGHEKWKWAIGRGIRRDRLPLLVGEKGMIYVRHPEGGIYAIDTRQAEKEHSTMKKTRSGT